MPEVSIILPTYNGKTYLESAVESILAQTYQDWELILVDDHSTDGSGHMVDRFAEADARIRAIHNEENQKLPRSLNIGFSAAKGKYLTWTSDDNLYMPDAIEVMAGCLDRNENVPMVRGSMVFIDANGRYTGDGEAYSDKKMYDHNCMGACFLYRKEVQDRIGGYDVDYFCVEDYDYWIRVLESFGSIMPIDRVLYRYRRHGESLSELRKKQVSEQLTRLRLRYMDSILYVLQEEQAKLCRIYCEMRQSESMTQDAVDRFREAVPELYGERPLIKQNKYIIFGAGIYGERAVKWLGDAAAFFMDNNPDKIGKRKCGLEILSLPEAVRLAGQHGFLIAVEGKNVYEMMCQLQAAGIKEYSIFAVERNCQGPARLPGIE